MPTLGAYARITRKNTQNERTCNDVQFARPKRRGSGKGVWVNPADLKSEQAGKTFDRPYRRRPNRPSMVVICEIAQKRERNEQMLLKNTFTAPMLLRILR